jgi:DNA-binding CsgD family transcriptional regulator
MYVPAMIEQQYETLVRLLPELYSARTLEAFPAHLVALVPRLIRVDSCGYNETNLARRRFETVTEHSFRKHVPDADEHLARLMHRHPMVVHNRNSDQRALKMSDLLSQRQFHRLELYNTVYRPARVEYLMTGGFKLSRAGDIVTIALGRESADFGEDDRDMLNLLRPHLQQAYANADAVTTFQSQLERREQSLEEAVDAAVVLVRDTSIKEASRLAIGWLSSFFDAPSNDQLPDRIRRWLRFCQDSVEGKQSEPKPYTPLMVESGEGRLNIRMLETRPDGDVVLLLSREGCDYPEGLRRLGLARRESEVLFWISKGKTSREIATILSITRKTVDKHVERIHRKLGTETRTAAAAIAWSAMHDSRK